MKTAFHPIQSVWNFYRDGFKGMTWGRVLWAIILLKLFILFAVLRPWLFRPALAGMTDAEKQETVAGNLSGADERPARR